MLRRDGSKFRREGGTARIDHFVGVDLQLHAVLPSGFQDPPALGHGKDPFFAENVAKRRIALSAHDRYHLPDQEIDKTFGISLVIRGYGMGAHEVGITVVGISLPALSMSLSIRVSESVSSP